MPCAACSLVLLIGHIVAQGRASAAMRASPALSRVAVRFDDPDLVSHAGLLPAASWWQRLGMPGVVARGLRLPGSVGANSDAKVATVVMGMLAGADSIEDLGVLRAGATGRLLGAARAPSTIGTWLRSFTYGHLRQLDAIARHLLMACWAAGAGPHRWDEMLRRRPVGASRAVAGAVAAPPAGTAPRQHRPSVGGGGRRRALTVGRAGTGCRAGHRYH